ncbi:MAG: MFS transporter [Actinobacteria bacterium]|nr:MFS transporter [Actinomycetota bacterium]
MTRNNRWAILAVLCGALFIVSLDNTIVNVALPSIQRDLSASTSELQWVVDAYAVLFAGFLLLAGSLGDRFGRRLIFVIGLVIFAIGSGAAAFTHTGGQLALCRALMGIGGAFVMPSTLSILVQTFPEPRERTRAIGIWAAVSGLGVAIGPLAGGALLEHFTWHSVFTVNPPIAVLVLVAAFVFVPESVNPLKPRLDLVGAFLWAIGLIGLVLTIIELPDSGWSTQTITFGVVTLLAMVGFVLWERRVETPILPLSLFANRTFDLAITIVALLYFALSGAMFFFPQFLQLVQGRTPFESGLAILPGATLLVIFAVISPRLGERFGSRTLVVIGLLIVSGGLVAASTFTATSPTLFVSASLGFIGIGMGLALPHATSAVLGSVPPERAGIGSAVNETMGEVGSALGVAVLGALLSTSYRATIDAAITAAGSVVDSIPAHSLDLVRESLAGASVAIPQFPAQYMEPARRIVGEAFVNSMDNALFVGAGVVLLGAILAVAFFPRRLENVGEH